MGEQDDKQMTAVWVGMSAVGQSQAEAPRQSLSSLPIGPWHIDWIRWCVAGDYHRCSAKCLLYGVQMRWLYHFLDLLRGGKFSSLSDFNTPICLSGLSSQQWIDKVSPSYSQDKELVSLCSVGGVGQVVLFMNPSRCTDILYSPICRESLLENDASQGEAQFEKPLFSITRSNLG